MGKVTYLGTAALERTALDYETKQETHELMPMLSTLYVVLLSRLPQQCTEEINGQKDNTDKSHLTDLHPSIYFFFFYSY